MAIINPYAVSLVCAALVGAAVGVFVWRRRKTAPFRAFPLLMFALSWWSLIHAMEVASSDPVWLWFWLRLEYVGIATSPAFWLVFSTHYSAKDLRLSRPVLAGLFAVPMLTLVLLWSNPFHCFFFRDVVLDQTGPFPVLALTPGPGYWIHVAFSYLCLTGGTLLILRAWRRSSHVYRRQTVIILVGISIPFVANILYVAGVRPFGHLDITPFAFTLTGLAVAFGLFRYKLFDLLPLARDVLLENLRDGIIVVDEQQRIVDINPAAKGILGIQEAPLLGRDAALALAGYPGLAALFTTGREARHEVVLRFEPLLVMDAWLTPVVDKSGSGIGGLLVLRDITAAKKAEEELEKGHERMEILLHSLPQAVLVIHGNTRRILDVNPQACLLIGLPSDQIAGKVCHTFLCRSGEGECPVIKEGMTTDRRECLLINAEGEEIPVLKTALAVDMEGEPWLIECISDISEIRRAETERLEKEKLQALVETAGAVCHEMNQPLMALSAYGELCLMDLEEGHPAFEQIQKMLEQAGRMTRITRKLATVTSNKTRDYLKGKILDLT